MVWAEFEDPDQPTVQHLVFEGDGTPWCDQEGVPDWGEESIIMLEVVIGEQAVPEPGASSVVVKS